MFTPHTPIDRALIKASTCTPFWGGGPGKRPLFGISTANAEADLVAGRGSGKSTLAQSNGKIAGGCFTMDKESNKNQVISDLLSSHGMEARMMLFDNIKTLKFSSAFIESLITAKEIDGHVMYVGHGSRPNYLTYVMTMNEPMLSTDLATRCIPILINQPIKSANWDTQLESMLSDADFLRDLYRDIAWHLQQPVKDYEEHPTERWSLWWREVFSRVCDDGVEVLQAVDEVNRRRGGADADLQLRETVHEILRDTMYVKGILEPEKVAVYFPTHVLQRLLVDVLGRNCTVAEAGQRINAMKPQNLYYAKNGPDSLSRGFWWIGSECTENTDGTALRKVICPDEKSFLFAYVENKTAFRNAFKKARGDTAHANGESTAQ